MKGSKIQVCYSGILHTFSNKNEVYYSFTGTLKEIRYVVLYEETFINARMNNNNNNKVEKTVRQHPLFTYIDRN